MRTTVGIDLVATEGVNDELGGAELLASLTAFAASLVWAALPVDCAGCENRRQRP